MNRLASDSESRHRGAHHDEREVLAGEQRQAVDGEAEEQPEPLPLERERIRPDGSQAGDRRDQEELSRPDPRGRPLAQQEQQQQRSDHAAERDGFQPGVAPRHAQVLLDHGAHDARQPDARPPGPRGRLPRVELAAVKPVRDRGRHPERRHDGERRRSAPGQEARPVAVPRVHGRARAPGEGRQHEHVPLEQLQQQPARRSAAPAQHQDRGEAQQHAEADSGEQHAVVDAAVAAERVESDPYRLARRDHQQQAEPQRDEGGCYVRCRRAPAPAPRAAAAGRAPLAAAGWPRARTPRASEAARGKASAATGRGSRWPRSPPEAATAPSSGRRASRPR